MSVIKLENGTSIGRVVDTSDNGIDDEMYASAAGRLASVTRGRTPRPRRIMMYGVHGVGKTTWASGAPDAIFVPTEEGVNDIEVAKFPVAKTAVEFRANIVALRNEGHDFKTVVIDSLDWLELLIGTEVCERHDVKTLRDINWGKGYEEAAKEFQVMLNTLDELRKNGMAVILLSHCQQEEIKSPECDPYDKYTPRLHKTISALVQEWCDDVLFACYSVKTTSTDLGFKKQHRRAVDGHRIVRTQEHPFCSAKTRLPGLPLEIPLSWNEFAKYLPQLS